MVDIKTGVPRVKLTIYTDDLKYQISTTLGDPNSDILVVNTNKSLSAPSGTFQLTFVPTLDSQGRSWFDKLDAMDYVEIEFQGINDPDSHVVMRGLIDTVTKQESWNEGRPQRNINVSGRDLGSLLENHQIYYIPEIGKQAAIETELKVLAWKRPPPGVVNAAEAFNFIGDRFRECVDVTYNGVPVRSKLGFSATSTFPDDKTNLWFLCEYEGAFWNAFQQYLDKPFHEIFVYDAPNMAWLIMRPARLKDAIGQYHASCGSNLESTEYQSQSLTTKPQLGSTLISAEDLSAILDIMYPKCITITDTDLIDISVNKMQNEVFNYYLTIPTMMLLSKDEFRGVCLDMNMRRGTPQNSENPFFQSDPNFPAYLGKYGFRKLEVETVFINLDIGQKETRNKDYEKLVLAPRFIQKGLQRNRMLVAWFLHNEYLLSGSIDIRGTNTALIGTYVKHINDPMQYEYYIESVSHSFVLFESYKTTLNVTRGQPCTDKGGLVGLGEAGDARFKYERINKYYFTGTGTRSVNASVYFKPAAPEITATPKPKTPVNTGIQIQTPSKQWTVINPNIAGDVDLGG